MLNRKTKIKEFFSHYGILLILCFFGFVGISGLFYNYSLNTVGDEAPLTVATLRLIADQSLRPAYPTFYHMPLAVYFYLPVFVIFIFGLFWTGVFVDASSFKQFVILDYVKFFPLARLITLGLSLLSIYLIYRISWKLFKSRLAGVVSAYFLATSLLFIQMSHFGKVWIPQVFVVLVALYWITDLFLSQEPKIKIYCKSAFGVILALGTHFIGSLVYISFLIAHYFSNKKKSVREIVFDKKLLLANLLIVLAVLVIYYLNPYGFNNYGSQIMPSVQKATVPYDSIGGLSDINSQSLSTFVDKEFFYFKILWESEPLLLILGILGLGILFVKRRSLFYLLGSFIIIYYLSVSLLGQISFYILPIIPFLAISATAVFYFGQQYINKKWLLVILGFSMIITFIPVMVWSYRIHESSSRIQAMNFIYKNIPNGEKIINFDSYLTLNENRKSIEDIKKYTNFLIQKRAYLLTLPETRYPEPKYDVLTRAHYEAVPVELTDEDWHFVVMTWWNPAERINQLEKLKNSGFDKKPLLIKRFPNSATMDSVYIDLSSAMRHPLYSLFNQTSSGPIVDIYRVMSK